MVAYKGEIGKDGKAFGHGIATSIFDSKITYVGTFKDNRPHGLGKLET